MASASNARRAEVLPAEDSNVLAGPRPVAMAAGDIDIQIRTAKAYPRSIEAFKKKALQMATLDEETAASCCYKLPARKGGDGKPIEGPSVRLAEIISSAWGHLRIQGEILGEQDRFIALRGGCWDLETNVAIAVDVRRRITTKDGNRYSDDMINTTANAGVSIGIRNAVFHVVPRSYTNDIYLRCKEVARGDAATLGARRQKALEWFASQGATAARVFGLLGVRGIEDITLDHLETLTGYRTAVREGDTTIEELFADAGAAAGKPDPVSQAMAELACTEAEARQVLAAFDSLKMAEAHRLVQMRTLKGKATELLAMLVGMGATVPAADTPAAAATTNPQPSESAAPQATTTPQAEPTPAAQTTTSKPATNGGGSRWAV